MTPATPDEPIYNSIFGELNYDPSMEQWHATVALTPGHDVEVAIWWDETDGPFEPVLQRAMQAFKMFQASECKHRELLAIAMLERHRPWANTAEPLPETAEIACGLRADQVAIAPDGSMTASYDSEVELFGDHSIVAEIAADGTFDGFTLQG